MTELFSIGEYDAKFYDYFLDAEGNVWSAKSRILTRVENSRSKLNGHDVNIQELIRSIKTTKMWREYYASVYAC